MTVSPRLLRSSFSRPVVDQLLDELGVVDDLVVAAELRVLVLERVEAVRAGGDDLLDTCSG